jgi:hypothetical protein
MIFLLIEKLNSIFAQVNILHNMYRVKVKNISTDEVSLAWEHYSIDKKKSLLYNDIELKEELDSSKYKVLKEEDSNYPFYLFGIECGSGWFKLIKPIIEYIDKYNENKSEDDKIIITQIKEKYGTLRIYISHGTKELFDMIDNAERESEITCETCGSKNNVGYTFGYIQTICHDCIKKECVNKELTLQWCSLDDRNIYTIYPNKDDVFNCTESEYQNEN